MAAKPADVPVGTPLADIDIHGIMARIPHRYPLLLIDRVVELEAYLRAVGIKNVTINEPFFQGHFPADPIMPGVLLIEAMAQTAATLRHGLRRRGHCGQPGLFHGRRTRPASAARSARRQLRLEIEVQRNRLGVWKFAGRAWSAASSPPRPCSAPR